MTPPSDLLANVERPPDERPAPAIERLDPHPGYWPGSATGHAAYWQGRALAAEAALERMRELAGARAGLRRRAEAP